MTRQDTSADETLHATRNALKLGTSLIFTWGIAMAMRFLLPRYLGPERFGALSFADAFTATFFIALSLGVDLYVRKQVSVRPEHAADFFGGTFVLRILMSAALLIIMALTMHAMDRPPEVRRAVYLFAIAQFFVTANATLSALLHAKGTVGGMSVLAVATKIVWAVFVLVFIVLRTGLWGFAVAYLISESIETVILYALARHHLGLVFRVDLSATKVMLIFSLPYYLNTFATTAYGKLDVTLLAFLGSSREVGWYAAASAIAGLALLITPLIGWVLMPTLARAAARSHDELFSRLRGSTQLILSVAIPGALLLSLGAELGVRLLFGDAFGPAVLALRILAPTFVITYVAIVFAITLLMLERAWTLTAISIGGLAVNLLLNLVLVPRAMAALGDGGGGAGCALAMLGTELFVTSVMVSVVGRRAFDGPMMAMIAKSVGACAIAVVVDRLCEGLGWARLPLDVAVYLVVVIAAGALQIGEIVDVVRSALRGKSMLTTPPAASAVASDEG